MDTKESDRPDKRRTGDERFRSAFDNMLEGTQILDFDYRYLYLNNSAQGHNRRSNLELLGNVYMQMWPGIESTHVFAMIKCCMEERRPCKMDNEFVYPDGVVRWFELSIEPVPEGILILSIDVTQRKQMERALLESEERFRTMANCIPQLAWIARADGFIFWYNQRWFQYTGTTPQQMEGWGWKCVHDPKVLPKVMDNWQVAIDTGKPFEMEFPLRGADGQFRTFLTRIEPLKNAHGKVIQWFGTNTDVEGLKQAEEKAHLLNVELEERVASRTAQLQAANEELEAFTASVSHDLHAPLRHVAGYAELLHEDAATSLSKDNLRCLASISKATIRMKHLIDDLLTFSRSGQTELQKTEVNLDELVQELLVDFQNDTTERTITWEIGVLPVVWADRSLLRLVLVNLISNAIKFTSGRAEAKIEIGSSPGDQGESVVFIRDNGAGFDPRFADKLFGVFQRLHNVEDFEGTGIGLANVKRIIVRHGGRTWAEGIVDGGATFSFSIPRR